jgi:hypothetical protein
MPQRRLTIYGAIALAAPLLVLANTLIDPGDRLSQRGGTPLRPLLDQSPRLVGAVQYLAMAHRARMMQPEAHIVAEAGQSFLEFYTPFNRLEHGPGLTLFLVAKAPPAGSREHFPFTPQGVGGSSAGALNLGAMHPTAGWHRYPIPAVDDMAKYRAIVLWCAELKVAIGYASLPSLDHRSAIQLAASGQRSVSDGQL